MDGNPHHGNTRRKNSYNNCRAGSIERDNARTQGHLFVETARDIPDRDDPAVDRGSAVRSGFAGF
jgi:hypothetical protein